MKKVVLTALIAIIGAASGCKILCSFDPLLDTPGRPVNEWQVPDLYVPTDFLFLDGNELPNILDRGHFRYVRLYYRGLRELEKLRQEYNKEMPRLRWEHVENKADGKNLVIRYRKRLVGKVESCTITLMMRGNYAIVKAEIAPEK